MTKNGIVLSIVAVLLAAAYVGCFTDWFRKETFQIIASIRPSRVSSAPRDPDQQSVHPVSFSFSKKLKLTAVKVFAADDVATNKYPTALWHLVSKSNSVLVNSIQYGYNIKGMEPAVARMQPEPLQPDVDYILQLEAGSLKSEARFHTARATVPGK
jgi:hypothetical protein